jgi:predicted metal-dependent phosphoesterase TrpH
MTITKRYDLHCHSTVSDGSLEPKELIDLAVSLELTGISITDHDTFGAYTPNLFAYAAEKQIELIPGAEFSSVFGDNGIHVLAYYFDIHNAALIDFCEKHKERRKERNLEILDLLKKKGMEITIDDLRSSIGVVGRPHIAAALIKKGYVDSFQDAFKNYIGDGKPCFAPGNRVSLEETITMIHQAGGKAVLAHPILLKKRSLIKKLLEFPFDGVETFYANFSARQNAEIAGIVVKYPKLIPTGGSDFHGEGKSYSNLGSAYTSEENLARLKNG